MCALLCAIENNHYGLTEFLITHPEIDLSLTNNKGENAIILCCEKGQLDLL